jgi:hypothetical protein
VVVAHNLKRLLDVWSPAVVQLTGQRGPHLRFVFGGPASAVSMLVVYRFVERGAHLGQ